MPEKRTHLRLNQLEVIALLSVPTTHKSKSGFAHFLVTLGARLDRNSGKISLSRAEVDRIQRYIKRYRTGGYQSYLKKAFKRPLNLK